jgi:hypothetical protein
MSRYLAFRRGHAEVEPLSEVQAPAQRQTPEYEDALLAFADEAELPDIEREAEPPQVVRPWAHPVTSAAVPAGAASPTDAAVSASTGERTLGRHAWPGVLFLVVFALGATSAVVLWPTGGGAAAERGTGLATFESQPAGADVVVNGEPRGTTPIDLELEPGQYAIELRRGTKSRSLTLAMGQGGRIRQYIEFAPAAPASARLEITSDPSGARVSVDGAPRGVTPLALSDLAPGSHKVVISRGGTTIERAVHLEAGASAVVAVPLPRSAPADGSISFAAPFEMQIFEKDRLLGTTAMETLTLPAGRHVLDLASSAFRLRREITVDVPAGRSVRVSVPIPSGTISVNALPWAEVFIDGRSVGTTPLANIAVPVGSHDVVWRHPELGERRQTVTVTAQAPTRIGVDFNR